MRPAVRSIRVCICKPLRYPAPSPSGQDTASLISALLPCSRRKPPQPHVCRRSVCVQRPCSVLCTYCTAACECDPPQHPAASRAEHPIAAPGAEQLASPLDCMCARREEMLSGRSRTRSPGASFMCAFPRGVWFVCDAGMRAGRMQHLAARNLSLLRRGSGTSCRNGPVASLQPTRHLLCVLRPQNAEAARSAQLRGAGCEEVRAASYERASARGGGEQSSGPPTCKHHLQRTGLGCAGWPAAVEHVHRIASPVTLKLAGWLAGWLAASRESEMRLLEGSQQSAGPGTRR